MSPNTKKLSPRDADIVDAMIDTSNQLGIDLIEVVYTPTNGQPVFSIQEIHGYNFPIMDSMAILNDTTEASSWVEGILKFYPDGKGRCWGYIYDTPDNRHLIHTTFSSGWYRVIDSRLRQELLDEAAAKDIRTDRAIRTEIQIKKSKREVDAEKHAKHLADQLEDTRKKMKKIEDELAIARNEKQVRAEKRMVGIKIEPSDDDSEKLKG